MASEMLMVVHQPAQVGCREEDVDSSSVRVRESKRQTPQQEPWWPRQQRTLGSTDSIT